MRRAWTRHVERRTGGVDRDYLYAALGQQAREGPGPAPDVKHRAGSDLGDKAGVEIQIGAIGIERVVDLSEPRVLEDQISHARTVYLPAAVA